MSKIKYKGKKYIPSDTSYFINLTYPTRDHRLAGTMVGEQEPKECEIVSEPYEFEILTDILGEPITHWFINVKYKKDICRVLFKECNVDADLEQRIEKHYDRIQIYKYMYPH